MIKELVVSELFSDGDLKTLSSLSSELEDTFNKVQVHRTKTEMEVSVLNDLKFPTPASKYWQAMREQNAMMAGALNLSFEYRMEKVRLKKIIKKMFNTEDPLDKELLQIKKERKEYRIKDMKRLAAHKVREILEWSKIKERELGKMPDEEKGDVDTHQLISYTRRWINQTLEMGDSGSPSEKQNLVGQLKTGLSMCNEKGVLEKVLSLYSGDNKKLLVEACNG